MNGIGSGAYNLTGITYAPDGDVLSADDSVNGDWQYEYGPLNRLTEACSPNCSSPADAAAYVYDRFGNRWQENAVAGSVPSAAQLTFDANNHVTGASYDASGDLLSQGGNTFTFDAEGRISSADNGAVQYVYDAFGHRVEKTVGGVPTFYLHDLAGRPITELSSTGGFNRGEIYLGGTHLATYANSTTYFDYSDWLGTTRMIATLGGLEQSACTSWPFGAGLNCTSGTDYSPMHFTGQVHDASTGLDRPRPLPRALLHPGLGPLDDPGPAGLSAVQAGGKALLNQEVNPQDWDMYAYALGNPTTLSDPTGQNACSPHDPSQTDCKVTIVVADRTRDKNGNYNDQFTNVKNQKNYDATAKVYTSYKGGKNQLRGTFLIKTTPSSGKYATIQAGTYRGTIIKHRGRYAAILLSSRRFGSGEVPALGGVDPFTHKPFISDAELHRGGFGNITGFTRSGKAISEGCSVIACSEYPSFESATGLSAPAPQAVFTILLETAANGGSQ